MTMQLLGIGALGLMLSPSARHLANGNEARFLRVHDRGRQDQRRDQCRQAWREHGAKLVHDFQSLIGDGEFDGVVICAGKNGDDRDILRSIVPLITNRCQTNPFILHLSTVSARFVQIAHEFLHTKKIPYVNYPLTGGPAGAESASMLILASGDTSLYTRLEPLLKHIGIPQYFGPQVSAGAEVKLIGQLMVFNGLLGICSAAALKSLCFQESLIGDEQARFFDFLNKGAGGTRQWDVAVSKGIRDNVWDQGFMLHHAVVDAIYAIQLCQEKSISSLAMLPLVVVALSFATLLQENKGRPLATHALLKEMVQEKADAIDKQIHHKLVPSDLNKSLRNVIESLPESIQTATFLDMSLQDLEA